MAAEGQSDTMVSDIEVRIKQRGVTEFFHAEKMSPADTYDAYETLMETKHWMQALRWRAVHFNSDSDVKDKPRSG